MRHLLFLFWGTFIRLGGLLRLGLGLGLELHNKSCLVKEVHKSKRSVQF